MKCVLVIDPLNPTLSEGVLPRRAVVKNCYWFYLLLLERQCEDPWKVVWRFVGKVAREMLASHKAHI